MKQRHHYALLYGLFALVLALNFAPTYAGRNGSGTYSNVNTFTAGTSITAAAFNQNFSDIGTELTNSVAADGQTSMTGPLKASNGTAASPSYTFASDTDTGHYRIGANNVGLSIGGTKLVDYSSTGVTVTGTISDTNGSTVPPGTVMPYAGATAPTGYLLAYGQCVSRTTYATLFAVLSTTYDNACAGTDFGIPDLRGRAPHGDDDMGGSAASRITSAATSCAGATVGTACGAQTVTLARANLTNTSIPLSVSGSLTVLGLSASAVNSGQATTAFTVGGAGATFSSNAFGAFDALTSTGTLALNGGVAQTDVNKLPPLLILNYIVKH